jgi:hypothetical protein
MPCLTNSIRHVNPTLQQFVAHVENATTLTQIIATTWRLACIVAIQVIEEVIVERAQGKTEWPTCLRCGERLHSKGFIPRQITTLMGVICFKRRVGRCKNRCRIGQIAPLDDALGLAPHQRTGVAFKQVACLLAIFVPFETVCALLSRLLAASVSPAAVWHWVQRTGEQAIHHLNRELFALADGQPPAVEWLDEATQALPLLIGADGVMVPFRPKHGTPKGRTIWREIKVAVLARLLQYPNAPERCPRQPLVQRRLVAVLGNIDALRPRLWLEALRQGILNAEHVVFLSDGGRGFWRLFFDCFAGHAMGILDFYHAAQNLWKGAKSWLDGRTQRAREWFVTARRRLRDGSVDDVLADITAALALEGLDAEARRPLENLLGYLQTHRHHIDYARFKALGLPIGSGMVESACKWLIQQRFKGVGMRWSESGFNSLLHLRLAWVNGRFDELFTFWPSPNS